MIRRLMICCSRLQIQFLAENVEDFVGFSLNDAVRPGLLGNGAQRIQVVGRPFTIWPA